MKNERYSIEVWEDYILFHGSMTIEEAFDFMNFFEKKGFNEVSIGEENSCLCLMKIDEEKEKSEFQKSNEASEEFYEEMMEDKNKEIIILKEQNKNLTSLVRQLINQGSSKKITKEETENGHC